MRATFTFGAQTAKHRVVEGSNHQLWRRLAGGKNLFLIAGPCVIESEALCLKVARAMRDTCKRLGITYIFKASFDKANRTSGKTKRGPGMEAGLAVLAKVREKVGVPVLTDVHTEAQAASAAEVVAEVVALDVAAVVPVSVSLHAAAANTTARAVAPTARVFLFMSGSFPRTVTDTGEPTTGDPRSRRTPD